MICLLKISKWLAKEKEKGNYFTVAIMPDGMHRSLEWNNNIKIVSDMVWLLHTCTCTLLTRLFFQSMSDADEFVCSHLFRSLQSKSLHWNSIGEQMDHIRLRPLCKMWINMIRNAQPNISGKYILSITSPKTSTSKNHQDYGRDTSPN